jgi:hypothetical protein
MERGTLNAEHGTQNAELNEPRFQLVIHLDYLCVKFHLPALQLKFTKRT